MTKSKPQSQRGLNPQLLKILACPKCKGELSYNAEPESLDCRSCKLRYLVEEGIPILLIEEAQPI